MMHLKELDKETYLLQKRKRENPRLFREYCLKCFRPLSHCLCASIQAFQTRTRFVLLMHPQEAKKIRNGTGRLAHLALINSEIFTGLDFSTQPNIQALLADERYNPFILYPGKTSIDISEYDPGQLSKNGKIPLVFVIDGTWKAAKKMMKMSQNLHTLPRISIMPEVPSLFLIKQQPNILCLSTIEAIYYLLTEFEKKGLEFLNGRHKNLLDVLDDMVKIQLSHIRDTTAQGYRKKDGSLPREKVYSKKTHKVSPFFR